MNEEREQIVQLGQVLKHAHNNASRLGFIGVSDPDAYRWELIAEDVIRWFQHRNAIKAKGSNL